MENQVENLEVEKEEKEISRPKNLLFGAISYKDEESYKSFIQNMTLEQAVFVLAASANFAQSRGAFNLLEAETLANAIRTVRTPLKSENESSN